MFRWLYQLVVPDRALREFGDSNLANFAVLPDGWAWACHDCGWTAFSRDEHTFRQRVADHLASIEHTA